HQQHIGIANSPVVHRTGKVIIRQTQFVLSLDILIVVVPRMASATDGISDVVRIRLSRYEGIYVQKGSFPSYVIRFKSIVEVLRRQVIAISITVNRASVLADAVKANGSVAFQAHEASVSSPFV